MTAVKQLAMRLADALGGFAASRWLLARRGRFVIELHGVPRRRASCLPAALRPTLVGDELGCLLQWLRARFRCFQPEEFLRGDEPGVLVTFDDGFANQAEVALPLLEEHSVPAVFFVTTQHVEEPGNWLLFVREQLARHRPDCPQPELQELYDGMSAEQLRRCARSPWVTIGCHTATHPKLTRCDDQQLRRELAGARERLRELSGGEIELLAYPTGDYDARVAGAAREAGFRAAFVEDSLGLGLGEFEIPRVGLYSHDRAYWAAKLSGLHRRALSVHGENVR